MNLVTVTLIIKSVCLILTAILAIYNQHGWAIVMLILAIAFHVRESERQ